MGFELHVLDPKNTDFEFCGLQINSPLQMRIIDKKFADLELPFLKTILFSLKVTKLDNSKTCQNIFPFIKKMRVVYVYLSTDER